MKLTTPLEHIKGVGPKTAQALSAAGLETVADALEFLPRAYDDYSAAVNIADLQPGKVTGNVRFFHIALFSLSIIVSYGLAVLKPQVKGIL